MNENLAPGQQVKIATLIRELTRANEVINELYAKAASLKLQKTLLEQEKERLEKRMMEMDDRSFQASLFLAKLRDRMSPTEFSGLLVESGLDNNGGRAA